MRKGEELKASRYASAAALCNDYVTTYNIIPNNTFKLIIINLFISISIKQNLNYFNILFNNSSPV